jgi:hypothetical protein
VFTDDLVIQGPEHPGAVLDRITRAAEAVPAGHLKAGFAYASVAGVQLLSWSLDEVTDDWAKRKKRWLVSFDWGTTDPNAVDFLASLPNSQVRVPHAEEVVARKLMPAVCFHPKTLALHGVRASGKPPMALVVGSGNLTLAGLQTGHETASIAVCRALPKSQAGLQRLAGMSRYARALDQIWGGATELDAELLRRYTASRKRRPPQFEDAGRAAREFERSYVEQTFERAASLATASHLWVDIHSVVKNRGDDRPGNQIDLVRGTRAFFEFSGRRIPPNTILGDVHISYRGRVSTTHMRFANNSMDRLNLPIPGEAGPPSYDDAWLLFERLGDKAFRLTVLDARQLRTAKQRSSEQGLCFKMRSGRQYGVYTA